MNSVTDELHPDGDEGRLGHETSQRLGPKPNTGARTSQLVSGITPSSPEGSGKGGQHMKWDGG